MGLQAETNMRKGYFLRGYWLGLVYAHALCYNCVIGWIYVCCFCCVKSDTGLKF